MELIECKDCKYKENCPCGYSYANAACLTIQKKSQSTIEMGYFMDDYLAAHPLCAVCMLCGYYRKAKHVIYDFDGSKYTVCDEHCYVNETTED